MVVIQSISINQRKEERKRKAKMQKLSNKFLHVFTFLSLIAIYGHISNLPVVCPIETSFAWRLVFEESALSHAKSSDASITKVNRPLYALAVSGTQTRTDLTNSGTDKMIHVKFRTGTNIESPILLFPPELRNSIDSIRRLFSLGDEQLDKMGASRLTLWFEITLKAETHIDVFLKSLKRLDHVEVVELAPRAAPPPNFD